MKEFEQGITPNVQETSKQEVSAATPETSSTPAAKAPVSPPVPPATAAPVVPPVNAVPPAPQKTQSRALPYVMAVAAMVLAGIVQRVGFAVYDYFLSQNPVISNSALFHAMPWFQSLLSSFTGLAFPFFAGLIAYKTFRKALRFLCILIGAQSIAAFPHILLNLICSALVQDTSLFYSFLSSALNVLFSLLAIILACLLIRYFDRKAE